MSPESKSLRVAVAGGTGVVGRLVVDLLAGAGHQPVVLARASGVDLVTGKGLNEALKGVDVVIDVCNIVSLSGRKASEFFTATTENLLAAEVRAGVRHHIVLSIIGIDRVDIPYYAAKRRQEELVAAGPVPYTVLRAAQFFEFAGQTLNLIPGPIAVIPKFRSQPIAAREVAQALVDLAAGPPAGRVPELAGPEVLDIGDMARRVLRARGERRLVVDLRLPVAASRLAANGALLPTGPGPRGTMTFDDWLAELQPKPKA